jgi:hypothetical protein
MEDLKTQYKGKLLAVKDLPTLPTVLAKVSKLVEDPNSSTEQIARVISMDQVLSAKVLKMVNSPIYGFPGRIGTIQHALVLLGFNVIKGIIISTSVFDMMEESMKGLWDHSMGCFWPVPPWPNTWDSRNPRNTLLPGCCMISARCLPWCNCPSARKIFSRPSGITI